MTTKAETPNTVHGRLLESVHLSGYSFERACGELEWLLDDDRWKQVGGGFTSINEFLDTIDFSEFRIAVDQRKKLAKRLADIEASQRASARLLGVDHVTIRNDLRGENSPIKGRPNNGDAAADGENSPPAWFQSDVDPTREAKRAGKAEARRTERIQKLVEISQGNSELATDRKYPIIYADPPWRYEHPPMGGNRIIENHYPTMTLDEICALPVADLATPDAVLFMWATSPKLAECFDVLKAWGFDYRTSVVWVKDKIGMGFYVRNRHELLLIAKRGEPPMPHESARQSSVIEAPRTEHSAKPAEFAELIERMYPELPKIELFCRSPREGWDVWGNQAEVAA